MAGGRVMVKSGGGAPGFSAANAVLSNQKEWFRQPLYDRVNLATSLTGEYRFFSVPIGTAATLIRYETAGSVAKTKRDTILITQGQDSSKDYSVQGISMALIPNARTVLATAATRGIRRDKDNIREGGWLNFKIVDKNILDIPLLLIPEANSEGGVSTTGNDATAWAANPAAGPMWNFGTQIMLPAGKSFQVTVTWDGTITLAQSFDMYLFFYANVQRPI